MSTEATETKAVETPAVPVKQDEGEPTWLPARLARHENKLIKGLGVETADEAKALIEEARKLKAEKLTAEERMRAEIEALKPSVSKVSYLEKVVKDRADYEMSMLSDQQREAVLRLAGDDYGKQLDSITALRPTWAPSAPPVQSASTGQQTQPTSKPVSAPATTISTASQPSATTPVTENHKAVWESLKKENPFHAAAYLTRYSRQIFPVTSP